MAKYVNYLMFVFVFRKQKLIKYKNFTCLSITVFVPRLRNDFLIYKLLSHIDITRVGQPFDSVWETHWGSNSCFRKRSNERIWDFY